jgi:hypothetical protein
MASQRRGRSQVRRSVSRSSASATRIERLPSVLSAVAFVLLTVACDQTRLSTAPAPLTPSGPSASMMDASAGDCVRAAPPGPLLSNTGAFILFNATCAAIATDLVFPSLIAPYQEIGMQAWGVAQAQPSSDVRVCVRAVDDAIGSGQRCFVGEDTPDGTPVLVQPRIYNGPPPPLVLCTTVTVRTLGGDETVKRCTSRLRVRSAPAVMGVRG